MPITKGNRIIASLSDWETHAGPKSKGHWVDDRSAKEVARAWLASGEQLPVEVGAALLSHPRFGAALEWQAEPEAKFRFDDFAGEPRNSDLAVHVRDAAGRYLIAIEAKADEPYGETLAQTIAAARTRLDQNPRSNGLNRIQQLQEALFGASAAPAAALAGLRYQLLTAAAGALCEGERHAYSRTVLLIQEFVTKKTDDANHARNTHDLTNFMNALNPGTGSEVQSGKLYGPFVIPGGRLLFSPPEFYIGKVTRNLRHWGLTPRSSGAPTAGHQARPRVRCTFSCGRAWRPAVVARLARTLAIHHAPRKFCAPFYRVRCKLLPSISCLIAVECVAVTCQMDNGRNGQQALRI